LSQMPSRFSERDLYHAISSISYTGDPRMGKAENPGKVANIAANTAAFRAYYFEIPQLLSVLKNACQLQNTDWAQFPPVHSAEQPELAQFHMTKSASLLLEEFLQLQPRFRGSCDLGAVVRRGATTQSWKGILTAGLSKSVNYALEKRRKLHSTS